MLKGKIIDQISTYVRNQTNKVQPILDNLQKASATDQLVESYIADIALYMFQLMGSVRTEEFQQKHFTNTFGNTTRSDHAYQSDQGIKQRSKSIFDVRSDDGKKALKVEPKQTKIGMTDDGTEASKWMGVIIRGITQVKAKVIDNAPYRVVAKELDDLILIAENCFDQIKVGLSKQIDTMKQVAVKEAAQLMLRSTPIQKSDKYGSLVPIADQHSVLARIERFTADANEIARDKYLSQIWKFDDLHKANAAPAYVHRLKNTEVKHMGTVGEKLVITNNAQDNVDVFASDSPYVLKTIDIQGR